jgi:hypothetical protein
MRRASRSTAERRSAARAEALADGELATSTAAADDNSESSLAPTSELLSLFSAAL